MIENPAPANSTIDLKYSYRPKSSIFRILVGLIFGLGGIYLIITHTSRICFLKGVFCIDPPVSTILFLIGSLALLYESFKEYKVYKASKRDQFIRITSSNLYYPENTLKPSETAINFDSITNISLNPLTGDNRKMEIQFDNKKIIIEEKLLEYVGEFEEIWKTVNSNIQTDKNDFSKFEKYIV